MTETRKKINVFPENQFSLVYTCTCMCVRAYVYKCVCLCVFHLESSDSMQEIDWYYRLEPYNKENYTPEA